MLKTTIAIALFWGSALFSLAICPPSLFATEGYNEVFGTEGFALRPEYEIWQHLTGKPALFVDHQTAARLSTFPLGDKVKIYGVPFIINGDEYARVVIPGTRQRAKALRHFFYDIFIGEQRILHSTELGKEVTLPIINATLKKATGHFDVDKLREFYSGRSLEDINFLYGPDLMRASDGTWLVTEDNVGYLGGLIDSYWVERAFVEAHGLPESLIEREPFFQQVLRTYLAEKNIPSRRAFALFDRNLLSGDQNTHKQLSDDERAREALKFGNDWFLHGDHEYNRLANLFRELKIPIVEADAANKKEAGRDSYLERMRRGDFDLVFERVPPESWMDYMIYLEAVRTNPRPSIFPSFASQILSSKVFLPYIEKMIRFYLHEEPILKSANTIVLSRPDHLTNLASLIKQTVEAGEAPPPFVLKQPDGAQGSNVAILSRMTASQLKDVVAIITTQAMMLHTIGLNEFGVPLVAQSEVRPSYIPVAQNSWLRLSLDIRPLTVVLGSQVQVRNRPWGRGAFALGHSLNNVSQGAFEVVVLRHDECERALEEIGR